MFLNKRAEADGLSDDLKRKISEIHLAIRSGELPKEKLDQAEKALLELKRKLKEQADKMGPIGRAAIA